MNPIERLNHALLNGDRDGVLEALQLEPSVREESVGDAHRLILRYLFGHAMNDYSAFSGVRLADFVNGISSAFFDEPDHRPRHLLAAAKLCSGEFSFAVRPNERSNIAEEEDIDSMLLQAVRANDWQCCEDWLLALGERDGNKAVLERIWLLLTEPALLGHYRYEFAGYLVELDELFVDAESQALSLRLACRMGAQYAARHPNYKSWEEHERPAAFVLDQRVAEQLQQQIDELAKLEVRAESVDSNTPFNSEALHEVLDRADPIEVFDAITRCLRDGHSVRALYESLMLHSLGRLICGPVEAPGGAHRGSWWNPLKRQFTAVAEIPKCLRCSAPHVAARVLYHVAFLLVVYKDKELGEAPDLSLPRERAEATSEVLLDQIESAVRSANVDIATELVLSYLSTEYSQRELLLRLRQATADDSCGQRMLVDTWFELDGLPDRHLVLVAMARWGAYAHREA